MEARLALYLHRAGHREGKLGAGGEAGSEPGALLGRRFALHGAGVRHRIQKGRAAHKPAGNAALPNKLGIALDGLPVCGGVLGRLLRAQRFFQRAVKRAVLRRDLGRGAAGLAAGGQARVHQDHRHAPLAQAVGKQDAGHARADDQHLGLKVLLQRPLGNAGKAVSPNRSHVCYHLTHRMGRGGGK